MYLAHETAREYLKPVVQNTLKANEIFMPFTAEEESEKDLIDHKNLKFTIVGRPGIHCFPTDRRLLTFRRAIKLRALRS